MDLNDLRIPANRHGYVYLITISRPTDGRIRYYVGQHLAKAIDRSYLGSGFILNKIYKKYGKIGHKQLLLWAYSQDELNFYEQLCIHIAKLEYGKDCINLAYGGADGRKSKSTREKLSATTKKRWCMLTQEERELTSARMSLVNQRRWETRSLEEIALLGARISVAHAKRSASKKALTSRLQSKVRRGVPWSRARRQAHEALSQEEKDKSNELRSAAAKLVQQRLREDRQQCV